MDFPIQTRLLLGLEFVSAVGLLLALFLTNQTGALSAWVPLNDAAQITDTQAYAIIPYVIAIACGAAGLAFESSCVHRCTSSMAITFVLIGALSLCLLAGI